MSHRTCPLTWKAAALEEGRLEGADVVSFELHVTRCADCRAECKAIIDTHAAVQAVPFVALSPLAHARQRGALLARANDRFIRSPHRWRPWRLTLLGAAAVAAAAAIVVAHTPSSLQAAAHDGPAVAAPHCEVVAASERALWRAQIEGTTTRIDVADGEATVVVGPIAAPQRAVIRLPDGEFEAATSRFAVDVALGRTRNVRVLEGHVVLRGFPPPRRPACDQGPRSRPERKRARYGAAIAWPKAVSSSPSTARRRRRARATPLVAARRHHACRALAHSHRGR